MSYMMDFEPQKNNEKRIAVNGIERISVFLCIFMIAIFVFAFIGIPICAIIQDAKENKTTYDNGVPTYFIEPEGYLIARINCDERPTTWESEHYYYGYIKESDYNAFIADELTGNIVVLNPYEEGLSVIVKSDSIISIQIGEYKDLRK